MNKKPLLILLLALTCFFMGLQAQDLRPVNRVYALTGLTIVQAPGKPVITNGTILLKDGLIQQIGNNVKIPADAQVIAMDTLFAYAGFIDGYSGVGIKMPKVDESVMKNVVPSDPTFEQAGIQPDRSVRTVIDPTDKSIDDHRRNGFAVAQVMPEGKMLPGTAGVMVLAGQQVDQMMLKEPTALVGQLKGAGRAYPATIIGVMAKFEDLYKQAELDRSYVADYRRSSAGRERPSFTKVHEAFFPVIAKEIPMLFETTTALEIQRVISMKKSHGFNLVLGGVNEAWDLAPQLKSSTTMVWLSLDLPDDKEPEKPKEEKEDGEKAQLEARKREFIKKQYEQAALLTNAGINVGFGTKGAKVKDALPNLRKLTQYGMTKDQVLASLTTIPASHFGMESVMGSLDKGKIANITIFDQDMFEKEAAVKYVFVDGHLFDYSTKPKGKKVDKDMIALISGTWSYATETPMGSNSGTITLKNENGYFSGSITSTMSTEASTFDEATVDGTTVSFSFDMGAGGQNITISVVMNIEEDTFEGTLTAGSYGSFPMKGQKQPDEK